MSLTTLGSRRYHSLLASRWVSQQRSLAVARSMQVDAAALQIPEMIPPTMIRKTQIPSPWSELRGRNRRQQCRHQCCGNHCPCGKKLGLIRSLEGILKSTRCCHRPLQKKTFAAHSPQHVLIGAADLQTTRLHPALHLTSIRNVCSQLATLT